MPMKRAFPLAALLAATALAGCAHKPVAPKPVAATPAPAHPNPGEIVSRAPLATTLPGVAERIIYRTTDALHPDRVTTVSGVLLTPEGPPPEGGWPVVSWAHGTTGLSYVCAPSVTGIDHGPYAPYLTNWLRHGFAVVATDYPGMGGPGPDLYLNARAEGMSVLDAARAVTAVDSRLSQNVIIAGHSQGAHAAIAAAALAPTYAPDVHVRATIAVGTPYFNAATTRALLAPATGAAATHFAPKLVYMLLMGASLGEADPGFDPDKVFTPRAMAFYKQATQLCIGNFYGAVQKSGLTPGNALQANGAVALKPVLDWSAFPDLHLTAPLFLATGGDDTQVAPAMQHMLVHDVCAAGTSVVARDYRGQSHMGSLYAAMGETTAFAQNVLRGQAPATTCPAK